MQLMPRTAQYMANRRLSGQFLRQPEDNLALGQKYLQFLMNVAKSLSEKTIASFVDG